MRYDIGTMKIVRQLDDSYMFVTDEQEVKAIKESCSLTADPYNALFVKIGEAEYTEVWGIVGIVPYLSKLTSCLYSAQSEAVKFEISHTYHSIGDLAKTKRFPKTSKTFISRVESWIAINHRDLNTAEDIRRFSLYVAYSANWITAESAFNHYGLDRESLWIERKRY